MSSEIHIGTVRYIAAPAASVETGLLGWVSFIVNRMLHVNGVAVRRTMEGKTVLSFPAREGRNGQRFFFLRPVNDAARIEIEQQVLTALGHLGSQAP